MKFIEQLVEDTNPEEVKKTLMFDSYENMGFRKYNAIPCNDGVSLSIQASFGHYCIPRKTVPLDNYIGMELAIFKDGEFVSVDDVTNDLYLRDQLSSYYDGTVYGYVPIELLEDLYKDLTAIKEG